MASWDALLAFAAATLVFAALPGPALLYAAAQTLAHGRRGGLMAALGLHAGCYAHVVGAALGLSALFAAVPALYAALKIAGALYLVWLGAKLLLERGAAAPAPGATPAAAPPRDPGRAFLHSALVEVLNPKTAVFFIAFLPQFVDPAGALPPWAQFLVLGTLVNLAFSAADLVAVLAAAAVAGRVARSARAVAWLRRLGGGLLVGLGARLAVERT